MSATPTPTDWTWRRATVLAAGLGFALAAALPRLVERSDPSGSWPLVPALLAPLLLAGALLLPRTPLQQVTLLSVFPLLVALGLALPASSAPSAAAMVMICGAWAIYASLALRLLRPESEWSATRQPIVDTFADETPRQRFTRRLYATVLVLGGVTLAVVAPMMGPEALYREAWGEAASSARVLVAVAGGAASVVGVAAIVAPGLRRRSVDATHTLRRSLTRALFYLLAACAFAGVAWAMSRAR